MLFEPSVTDRKYFFDSSLQKLHFIDVPPVFTSYAIPFFGTEAVGFAGDEQLVPDPHSFCGC
jgi:hypothetical protein